MAEQTIFQGFSKQTVTFFRELKKHNDKAWFDAHKGDYEQYVKAPALSFIAAMGERLRKVAPGLVADPRVNRSLFRIQRDARFSHDKSPYKTHLGIWMWEGPAGRMENSGFYFQVEPPNIGMGAGMYRIPREILDGFRRDVAHATLGKALADAVKKVEQKGHSVGGEHYKRVPRGFDPDHANARFLKHGGLFAWHEAKIPPEFFTARFVDYCGKIFEETAPVHKWLLAMTERQA